MKCCVCEKEMDKEIEPIVWYDEKIDKYFCSKCNSQDFKERKIFSSSNTDSINPSWYKSKSGIEVIDIIEAFDLDYYQATAIKYILRAGKKHKETEIEDYKKALWFIDRKIKRLGK